jgi:hypothetical protein
MLPLAVEASCLGDPYWICREGKARQNDLHKC